MSDDPEISRGELVARISEATAEAKATQGAVKLAFTDIQRQLNLLSGLPASVARFGERLTAVKDDVDDLKAEKLPERMTAAEHAISEMQEDEKESREWHSVHKPTLMVSVVGVLIAVVSIFHH